MRIIEIDNGGIEIFRDNGDTVALNPQELFAVRSWLENNTLCATIAGVVRDEIDKGTIGLNRYNVTAEEFCVSVLDEVRYRLEMYPDRLPDDAFIRDAVQTVADDLDNEIDDNTDDRDDEYFRKDD